MASISASMRHLVRRLSVLATIALSSPVRSQGVPKWEVLPRPVFDITGIAPDGTVLFEHPVTALRASNGSVLVADAGPSSIRVFDPSGKLARTVGRAGRGPREFPGMLVAAACGDSILVWDSSRIVIVAPTGDIARTVMIPSGASPLIGCSPAGSIAYVHNPSYVPTKTRDVFITRSIVSWLDAAGRPLWQSDSILEGARVNAHPGGYRRPLGTALYFAFVDSFLAVAPSDSARIWFFARDGKRNTIQFAPGEPRAPTASEYAIAVKQIADRAPASMRTNTETNLLKLERPATLPAFYGMWGDSEGCLWVRLSPPGGTKTELLVLKPGRGVIATVVVERDIEIQAIGPNHMTVFYDDASDETHIAVIRFIRR